MNRVLGLLNFLVIYMLSWADGNLATYRCKRCGELVGIAVVGQGSRIMRASNSCEQCFFGPIRSVPSVVEEESP